MKNKSKKHLALLMAFAMILSTCIGTYAEVLTQDGTSGVIQSQEMPPGNEREPENFLEGDEIGSEANPESGQPEELGEPGEPEGPGEPEELGEPGEPEGPGESEGPGEPGQPEEPGEPGESEGPGEPEESEEPAPEPGLGDAGDIIDNNVESGPTELIANVGGVTIKVVAGEGVLPGGTELSAHRLSFLEALDYIEAIEEDTGEKLEDYMVFDIKLLDREGNEVQPDGSVTVTFSDVYFADDDIVVYHLEPIIAQGSLGINSIRPNGGGLKPDFHLGQAGIKDQFRAKDMRATKHRNDVVFTTNHFSIYAVGTYKTATYKFYAKDESGEFKLIDTQIVKDGEKLFEPEVPGKIEGKKFIGWYIEGEEDSLEFGVPVPVTGEPGEENDEIKVYAR